MIKKILVALDPDTDTAVATRYAVDVARRYEGQVTGLAVVDMGSIEASGRGGGIGSMYLMEKVQKNLTEEARAVARRLTEEFNAAMEDSGVEHDVHVEEGAPFQRIIEDMKYHDLLVVGKDPHFFYSHPEKKTKTLVRVVRDMISPTLVVPATYRPVRKALVAYDGSQAAARALRRFIHLQPFGTDVSVEIFNVHDEKQREGAQLELRLAREYMQVHGYEVTVTSELGGDPAEAIVAYAGRYDADVVVAGAHSVSRFTRLAFGSTTAALLENSPVPLFLDH
ncbi:MAG: universal stress protein [Rhodothermales bacterium]|nr:universal stress protein [Rhodothermales bacterium]